MKEDISHEDTEMIEMIVNDTKKCEKEIEDLEKKVLTSFLPKDALDNGSALLEIRSGVGGDEASLFSQELLDMYEKYSFKKNWDFQVISKQNSSTGFGIRVTKTKTKTK